MTQATTAIRTTVTLNEHANGTFDVVYHNPKNGKVPEGEKDLDLWLHLITAVICGVSHQLGHNTYRDTTDYTKARNFINSLIHCFPAFSKLSKVEDNDDVVTVPITMGEMATAIGFAIANGELDIDDRVALSEVLETIHVSGSIAGKENPEEMSGLVTITYRFPEDSESCKVRLSGKQIEQVGLALAAPYRQAKENGTLEISKVKVYDVKTKTAPVQNEKVETGSEVRLAKDQLEELARMVTEKLLFAMNKQNQGMRPKHHPKQPRVIAHVVKNRDANKAPQQPQTQQ